MDIRSYFPSTSKKPATTQVTKEKSNGSKKIPKIKLSDDEEVIPESPVVNCKQKDKKKKRPRIYSDSDDDCFVLKSVKSNVASKPAKSPSTKQKEKHKEIKKPVLKEVSAVDIFGRGPVHRTPLPTKKEAGAKEKEASAENKRTTEVDVHMDDDFEKTLVQLDNEAQNEEKKDKNNGFTHSQDGKDPKSESTSSKSSSKTSQKTKSINEKHKNDSVDKKDSKDSQSKKGAVKLSEQSEKSQIKDEHKNDDKSSRERSRDKISAEVEKKSHKSKERSLKISPLKNNQEVPKSKSPFKKDEFKESTSKIKTEEKHSRDETESPKQKSSKLSRLDQKKLVSEKVYGKKDFSMFIYEGNSKKNNDMNDTVNSDGLVSPTRDSEDHDDDAPKSHSKSRKRKNSSSELTEEERQERKRYSSMLYKSYLNRSGPKHLGSKEIPEGTPKCLSGLAFLVTGVLDSLEREDVAEIVKKCGGEMKSSLTGKVTHLICGEEAGPAKIAKAEKLGTAVLSEDGFLDLIRQRSGAKLDKSGDVKIKEESTLNKKRKTSPVDTKEKKAEPSSQSKRDVKTERNKNESLIKKLSNDIIKTETKYARDKSIKVEKDATPEKKSKYFDEGTKVKQESDIKVEDKSESTKPVGPPVADASSMSWVDKYKPATLKQIIGQHGDSSNVNKLLHWLSSWYESRKLTNTPKPSPWAKDHKGTYYRAALLSGPPGVGKTTSVGLVCKELGFDTVEFNASDTRSKHLLKEHLTDLVSTNSLAGYVHGKKGKGAVSKKHVVIMDEVDGMAGNEDRGGMQELISLIKTTAVPIICMCNDKTSQKMRSLVNNCFDLTYSRPKVEQIKAAMMTICFKEGIKILPQSLQQMIIGANQDVRQILNLLSVWSAADKNMSAENVARDSKQAHKDMKMGPWDVVRKVFSEEEHKSMSIHDKSDLFFHDYSLSPLFVQQNYVKVAPHCHKKDMLRRFAEAADCISVGDLVDNRIRKNMAWSLLPLQAMYSSVLPGEVLAGHIQGQIEFPSWLGQNSRTNKMSRLAQELHSHTGLSTTGSKLSIRLDYAAHIRDALITPLVERGTDGVHEALEVLQTYHLLREDLESLLELTHWPGKRDPYAMVDSKVKSALTRAYNKEAVPLPYSAASIKRSRSALSSGLDTDSETLTLGSEPSTQETEVAEEVDEEEDSDVEHDALIKKSKKTATTKPASSSKETKAKGPTKGKGKKK